MSLTVHDDLVQGSDEWLQARLGMVTASTVGALITPTLKVADNETSRGLRMLLVAERITGHIDPVHVSDDMLRGQLDEPLARAWYSEHRAQASETGFMVRDDWGVPLGYSPDGLVWDEGLIEIKSRRAKTHLKTILSGQPPKENMAQMQAGMPVSGRAWCDYVSWCGGMPPFVTRVHADQRWADVIVEAVVAFEEAAALDGQDYAALTMGVAPAERIEYFQEARI